MRLDLYLVQNNYVNTRTRAQNLIKLRLVQINGQVVDKSSYEPKTTDTVTLIGNYAASLGGIKLEKAIEYFNIDINSKICLDVGASNGGFTEVLLNNGASKVYALDVGECALPEYLRNNPKVEVKDKTNVRDITSAEFDCSIDFVVIDVSFISLDLVLPKIFEILPPSCQIVALIKPQFELTKKDLTKTGMVKSKKLEESAVKKITNLCIAMGKTVIGTCEAPHPFENKNQEYLIHIMV